MPIAPRQAPLGFAPKVAPLTASASADAPHPERWNSSQFLNDVPALPETTQSHRLAKQDLDLAETFRHSGWNPTRQRVRDAMLQTPGVSTRRLSAFCTCGVDACIEQRTSGWTQRPTMEHLPAAPIAAPSLMFRLRSTKCHDRFCVPCSRERGWRIRSNLLNHMQTRKNLSLIGLTLEHSGQPLRQILDRLTRSFRALRQLPLWKRAVKGGVAIIETKLNDSKTEWHAHFHIIAETDYIDQKKLSDAWMQVTGDSYIVDIRRVGAHTGAVQYITKYITKATDHSITTSPRHLQEALVAFASRRLITTFGTWRGLKLSDRPPDEEGSTPDRSEWTRLASLGEALRLARAGDPRYISICEIVFRKDQRPKSHAPP